ncbi:MAG: hypothetical protein ACD_12C00658G0006 [uncultured bacterium]|nr:MAG: hypothetical protein ACD_12C00658G0006 [uncultured bacterium]
MYKVFFTKDSKKDLNNISKEEEKQIILKINQLNFPFPISLNIKKLSGGENFYRLKMKKIRAIFMISFELKQIIIRKIGYRKDVYRFF